MMISNSNAKRGSDLGDYGFARVRDLAFDAVLSLWRRRSAEGMKQTDIATKLNRDPAWVSRQLGGPGNWTLRTFGELVEAMDGEAEIQVFGINDGDARLSNFDAYSGYGIVQVGAPYTVKSTIENVAELTLTFPNPSLSYTKTTAARPQAKVVEVGE